MFHLGQRVQCVEHFNGDQDRKRQRGCLGFANGKVLARRAEGDGLRPRRVVAGL